MSRPKGLKWRSSTALILATVAMGLSTDLFLYALVVTIMPFISILLACYAGAQVLFSFPAGVLANRVHARQLPLLLAAVALFASTGLLYLGRSMELLILARVLQGMNASVMWTIGLAMVVDAVGPAKLGATMGTIFSVISIGELLAPILGGLLYHQAGSDAVFGLTFGLLAIDFLMRLVLIDKRVGLKYGFSYDDCSQDRDRHHNDEADERSSLLTSNSSSQWKIPKDLPASVLRFPILCCFTNPRLIIAELLGLQQAIIFSVFSSTLSIEAQALFGFNSLQVGLLFIPLLLPCLILGPLAGRAVDRYGTKIVAVTGLVLFVPTLVSLRIPTVGGTAEIIKLVLVLVANSVSLACISSPSAVESISVITSYHKANIDLFGIDGPYGHLYAVNGAVFSGGLAIGPLIGGLLRDSIGYGNMNAVIAGMCCMVAILCLLFFGGPPRDWKR